MILKIENFIHPEVRNSEIFFSNSNKLKFKNLNCQTKRKGLFAYDGQGKKLNNDDWFPVFLTKNEVISSGKTLQELRILFSEKVD